MSLREKSVVTCWWLRERLLRGALSIVRREAVSFKMNIRGNFEMRPFDVSCRICPCANQTCARARYLAIGVTVTGSHPACNRAAVDLLIFDACLARCARAALSSSAINGRVSLE